MGAEGLLKPRRLYTIGHSTRPVDQLIAILKEYNVDLVVDIRNVAVPEVSGPFARGFPDRLRNQGISYCRPIGLSRFPSIMNPMTTQNCSLETLKAYRAFRESEAFQLQLRAFIEIAAGFANPLLFCAETLPWRCHRSFIADALLALGIPVTHLLKKGLMISHSLAAGTAPGGPSPPEKKSILHDPL